MTTSVSGRCVIVIFLSSALFGILSLFWGEFVVSPPGGVRSFSYRCTTVVQSMLNLATEEDL